MGRRGPQALQLTQDEACPLHGQERLDEAEMKGIIDPDFERDVQVRAGGRARG